MSSASEKEKDLMQNLQLGWRLNSDLCFANVMNCSQIQICRRCVGRTVADLYALKGKNQTGINNYLQWEKCPAWKEHILMLQWLPTDVEVVMCDFVF